MSEINPNKNYDEYIIIPFKKISSKGGQNYSDITNAIQKFKKMGFNLEYEQNDKIVEEWSPWFNKIKKVSRNDNLLEIKLKPSPELRKELFDLKNNFTKFQIKLLKSFKSFYSIRLYQCLKSYEKLGKRKMDVDWIKEKFEIITKDKVKYKRMDGFIRRIIEEPIKEINKISDINVTYVKIKDGRNIVAFDFKIKSKNDVKHIEQR